MHGLPNLKMRIICTRTLLFTYVVRILTEGVFLLND